MKHLLLAFIATLTLTFGYAQTITVVNPNGAEILYSCNTYTIKWNTTGTLSNYYDIAYSLDGGTIWASVASNYLSTNGQYVWTVPNVQSSTCLIRVRDAQNTVIADQSNAVFAINIPVTLLSPNGGETVQGGNTQAINWNAQGTSNTFNLYYSINGGSTWTTIVTNYSTVSGTYNWLVPNIPSTNVLIRVVDYVTSCMQDQSNAPFTIIADDPVLISPNGGGSYFKGCSYNITWNTATFYTSVMLEYSTNNGSSWTTIVASTSNDGSETWTVPDQVSGVCLVRASNVGAPAINDISDATFSIAEPITVTSPNGGETFYGCSTYNITWSKPGNCISTFILSYSIDNGTSWVGITSLNNSGAGNSQSYAWVVPNGITASQALIRVQNGSQTTVQDISNTVFNIAPSNDITVTAPNGGEVLNGLTTTLVTWTNLPSASGQYNLDYSRNGGLTWTSIVNGITGNAYTWNVPNQPSTNCLFRVQDAVNSCKFDVSNSIFTISAALPVLTYPNGGNVLNAGCPYDIRWDATTMYTSVRIDYSANGGTTWNNITTAATNNGVYSWTPPLAYGTNYLVKIANTSELLTTAVSATPFTVRNPIAVTSPNGGETLNGCSTYSIIWTKPGNCISDFTVSYSINDGSSWVTLNSLLANTGTGNVQSIPWTIPNGITSSQVRVRVQNGSGSIQDISDAVFNIAPTNDITVTAPNGGEVFTGLSSTLITWTNLPSASGQYNVEYSRNGGTSWSTVATDITGNSYLWTVPNFPTVQGLIRVVDYANTCKLDQSNAAFTILPATPILLTPNGGNTLNVVSNYEITWNPQTYYSTVRIDYSLDNGASWLNIVTSTSNDGTHTWSVPNTPSTQCLIKISNTSNLNVNDVSDAAFAIASPVPVLLFPNGGNLLNAGCAYNIRWDATTMYSTVRIDYSADGGTTWNNITTSTPNDGEESWTLPLAYGTNYLVKIANTSDLLTTAVSATPFTVRNPITVTSPNGGETLYGCSTYNITWNRPSGCITSFTFSYSLDNGANWTAGILLNNTGTGNTQSYAWTVPNGITTSQALIRIRNSNATTVWDVSDAVFSIEPSNDVTVTSPNGGETINALSNTLITWTNLPSASGLYNLMYSTNGGTNWTSIATGITGNAYNWTVPNIPSTNCLIQVSDAGNSCKTDQSNSVFRIAPPLPVLLNPNTAVTLNAGCSYTIRWDATRMYTTVRIDYSSNGGTTWNNITTSTPNDGEESWTPPQIYSANYLIKIANSSDILTTDVSDVAFSVKNPITVTSLNGGDTLYGCSTFNITWNKPGTCISTFALFYSIDNGVNWQGITTVSNTGSGSTQSVLWTVPNGITTSQALIRVQNGSGTLQDFNDAVFTIMPSNDITVTSPNGGEVLTGRTTATLTWTNKPSASGQYDLYYSVDGVGGPWYSIATGVTGNSYSWSVPNVYYTNCLFRVNDVASGCRYDISDNPFTIMPTTPVLLYPEGGNQLNAGCSITIRWDPATIFNYARIDYSSNGGVTWTSIDPSSNNDGQEIWTTPYAYGSNYLVRVSNSTGPALSDVSTPFTVKNPITITSPNGGETLYGCSTYNITWTKPGNCISTFGFSYSLDNGITWTNGIVLNNSSAGNTQSYAWTVPNGITSSQALIRLRHGSETTIQDVSDAVFNIAPTNDITLTSPNGGEVLTGLTNTLITWTNLPTASGQYSLWYSTNGGSTWSTIASDITGNAYLWSVPNIPSSQVMVRVIDYVNSCKTDQSDAVFTILPATPILLSPNGGQSLYAATSYNITWNAATYYSAVRIDYSIDNGASWLNILTSTPNDGTQSWSIPNTPSAQCLVKISNTADLTVNDVSNSVFTIKPAVRILTPNGDDGITNWGGCTVTSITFDHTPAYSSWDISYSLNGGTTWINEAIAWSQTANPATYNWSIPNTSSANVLMRVMPNGVSSAADQSDAPFTVTKPVKIVQPNFGGIMQVGSVYNISWNSEGISNLYDIFYSSNGGTTWTPVVIGYNTSTNTYPWTVPNAASTNCRIRVRDNISNCKEDTSDLAFTISNVAPALTVLSPNGGELLSGCTNKVITWAESAAHGNYDISYSTNSGNTWIPIVTNYPTTTRSYNWVVPNLNNSTVLVKVKATGTGIEDLSNALFSIQTGSLTVATRDTTICPGSPVQLQADGAATYTWTPATGLSNANIANPVATPSATTTYTVRYTNGSCALQDEVTITTDATGASPVSVSIAASATTICSGTGVTFTATPVNGGSAPAYQWKVNGVNTGTNSATFTSSTLTNNAVVTVVLTSNATCIIGNPATSNAITMSVTTTTTPSVSVAASATTFCAGTPVTFTATPVNGGATPTYVWKVNGNATGSNNAVFTTNSLTNGAVVTATLTSSLSCSTGGPVTSIGIPVTVNNVPDQPGTISGTATVCAGVTQTYSVAAIAGATAYQWTFPSGWTGSSTTRTINLLSGATGGVISVTASNGCGASVAQSIPVSVYAAPVVTANVTDTDICQGESITLFGTGAVSYTWTNASNGVAFTPTLTGSYTVTGTDVNGCKASDMITVSVHARPAVVAHATTLNLCGTGNVTLTGSGASTYAWDHGVTNGVAFAPVATTTYTVTGTDANGCSATDQLTVAVNTLPIVNAGADQAVCAGTAVSLSGGGASTYAWNNGVTNGISFVPAVTQTYTVTGTAANGCTATDQVTITVNAAPVVGAAASPAIVCQGTQVTLNCSGAATYVWNHGVTNGVAFTPSSTQTYTVTGTDANGCTDTEQLTVTVNALPSVGITASATVVCAGTPVTLSGTGAVNYSWNNGVQNGVAFTPTVTQTYTVTGTSAAGCTNTAQVTVVVNAAPAITAGGGGTICPGSPVTLTATGGAVYNWNNSAGSGTSVSVSPAVSTIYTVTGTSLQGCTATDQVLVTVSNAPTLITSGNTSICAGGSAELHVSGATNYSWNNSGGTGSDITVSPAATTTYTVTGTDANGCTDTEQLTVTVNALPSVGTTASATVVCAGTPVTLSGTGAVNYSWSNGVQNGVAFTPTTTQTYTVTGTSATGCTNTAQVTVVVHAAPAITAGGGGTICPGSAVTLTATGGAVYNWNNSAGSGALVSVSPAASTIYTVTGTSLQGCTATDQVLVTVSNAPTLITSGNTSICAGGSAELHVSGATNYSWSNGGGTGADITVSPAATTTYTVIGTDANGCTDTEQLTVTVNALPSVGTTASATAVCAGTSVTLSGTGAVNYSWSNGVQNGVAFTPTATQTYTVTGTSAEGCTNTAQVTITVHAAPTVEASGETTICPGGTVALTATGAALYSWNNGAGTGSSVSVSPVTSTIYTVTGTSLQGCTATDQVLVTVSNAPTLAVSANTAICVGGSVALHVSGATAYSWNNGGGTGADITVSPAATTTYVVTGTNPGGCTSTAQVTVTVNQLPAIQASGAAVICAGETAVLNAIGGVSYSWNNGAGAGASVSVMPAVETIYTVTGTDANGCVNTSAVTVDVLPTPTPLVVINGGQLQTGTYASYQWYVNNTPIPGAITQSWSIAENGEYYVLVSDGNGCVATSAVTTITTASLEEQEAELVQLYPNPATSAATVDFGDLPGVKKVQLMDMTGKVVLTVSSSDQQLQLDLSLATGSYAVVVTTADHVIHLNKRLIVQSH